MKIIEYHNDPAHGWYKVTSIELRQLGIEHKISNFSYRANGVYYLEEDQDAGIYFAELNKMGVKYQIKDVYHNEFPLRTQFER